MITDERLLKIERHPKYPRLFKELPIVAPLSWLGEATYNYTKMVGCQLIETIRFIAGNVFDCSVDDFVYSDAETIDFNLFPEIYPVRIRVRGRVVVYMEFCSLDVNLILADKRQEVGYLIERVNAKLNYSPWDLYSYLPTEPFIQCFEKIKGFCETKFGGVR